MKVEFDHVIATGDLWLRDETATVQAVVDEHPDGGQIVSLTTVLIVVAGKTLDVTNNINRSYRHALEEIALDMFNTTQRALRPRIRVVA